MKCAICGTEVETIDEAMEQNWIPSFYEAEVEHGPLCSSCAEIMICMGEDGVMGLKSEYFGKIQYVDGDYSTELELEKEDLAIEIFMTEQRKGEKH